jgi:hypothetical protein
VCRRKITMRSLSRLSAREAAKEKGRRVCVGLGSVPLDAHTGLDALICIVAN